jgi:hypothetical protein
MPENIYYDCIKEILRPLKEPKLPLHNLRQKIRVTPDTFRYQMVFVKSVVVLSV